MDVDDRAVAAKLVDFLSNAEHKHTRLDNDDFYELKVPLATIGVTRTYLETTGIGVFILTGGRMDTIPHDEVTNEAPSHAGIPTCERKHRYRLTWAQALAKVFEIDVHCCPRCGQKGFQQLAVITDARVLRAMIAAIDRKGESP